MYLVDTSVWIDFLRGSETQAVNFLTEALKRSVPVAITGIIYQEILQGSNLELEFKRLEKYFSTQLFLSPQDEIKTYKLAAKIYFDCRQQGVTIRSTLDCLIAQIAMEHNSILLHSDRDFERIAEIYPKLKHSTG